MKETEIELTEKDFKKMITWRKDINNAWAMQYDYDGLVISWAGSPGTSKRIVARDETPRFLEYVNSRRREYYKK